MLATGIDRWPAPSIQASLAYQATAAIPGCNRVGGTDAMHLAPAENNGFAITRRSTKDVVVLAVSGAVDEVTTPSLATHLDVVLLAAPALLVIDLTAVEFMSSAGMNLLVETQRLTAPTMTTVCVAADGTATSRPMRFIGIDRIIELYPTVDEALHGQRRTPTGATLPVPL
jgi:anti-sigma B factor antagonist